METHLSKKNLGQKAEIDAKQFLLKQNWQFVTQNYFTKFGEIDLIFMDHTILVFVEVKMRTQKSDFDISINPKKVKNIRKTAEIFLEKENINFTEIRFDVIFVNYNKRGDVVEIGHRPNFF